MAKILPSRLLATAKPVRAVGIGGALVQLSARDATEHKNSNPAQTKIRRIGAICQTGFSGDTCSSLRMFTTVLLALNSKGSFFLNSRAQSRGKMDPPASFFSPFSLFPFDPGETRRNLEVA